MKQSGVLHADCRVFEVSRQQFRHPARKVEKDFFVIESADWVNVIALTPDRRMVLVNQFRFGLNDFSLEIPGGLLEPGEDPVAGGLRELLEETGYSGKNARLIGSLRPNPAIMNNTCHLVLVEDAVGKGETSWDADEEITIHTLTVEETFALARNGRICHSIVLNALFFFQPVWAKIKAGSPLEEETGPRR